MDSIPVFANIVENRMAEVEEADYHREVSAVSRTKVRSSIACA